MYMGFWLLPMMTASNRVGGAEICCMSAKIGDQQNLRGAEIM